MLTWLTLWPPTGRPSRAKCNDKLSNYIVLWKADHSANFYFRIIPESNNFGMIYESVDVCGEMAGLL
jgi:hypothetical protein